MLSQKTIHAIARLQRLLPLLLLVTVNWSTSVGAEQPLANIQLPGKNYLNNGSFERGEEGWEFFAGRKFGGVVKDEKHTGEACFKASGAIGDHCYFQQNLVPLTPGKTYTLSAWLKCSGLKREGQVINLTNYGWTKAFDLMPKKPDEDWTRYSVTFQAPPTQDNGVQPIYNLIVYWPPKTEGTLWIDDLQIEEGEKATGFTDRYFGWAFDTLATLRRVTIQAEAAKMSLDTDFKAYPIAQTLSAKAGAVLGKARMLADRLNAFDTLSTPQAQSLKGDAEELTKEVAALKSVYFLGNPYVPLTEVNLLDKPPTDLKVVWTCLKGEQRAIAVNVANLTRQSSISRIVPGELMDVARGTRVVGTPWLAAYNVPPIRGHVKPNEVFTDPMPRMDEAGEFLIGSNGISQAVLILDTSSLLPGEYRGSVEVASLGDAEDRRRITVKLTVLPVRLPRITDKDICTVGAMADYATDSIEPMGINTFTIPAQWLVPEFDVTLTLPSPSKGEGRGEGKGDVRVDFARIAPLVKTSLARCPDARFLLAFGVGAVISNHLKQAYNVTSDAPLFKVFATNWVKAVVKGFGTLGVPPERIIFETVDEPGEGQLAEAVMWAEVIKAAEPKAQTHSYVTSFHSEDKASARLYETHDITAPGFTSINEQTVSTLRKLGKKVWVYDCQNNGETFHPIAYYRLLPWLARRYGLDGWGHFSWLDSERGRGYEPWEGVAEESLVYPNLSGGQVISRRWLAIVAGTQDYRVMVALDRLVSAAKRSKSAPDLVAKAETLLSELPAKALALLKPGNQYFTGLAPGADPSILDQFRESLASLARELAGALAPSSRDVSVSLTEKTEKGGQTLLSVVVPGVRDLEAHYLCDEQLPWRSFTARTTGGKGNLPLVLDKGERVNRCFVETTNDDGLISVVSPLLPVKVAVDSTIPDYNSNRLNDGLAVPGMKFEPEHGWISGGAATDHWVAASLDTPSRVSGVRLWWMTFYGLPQAYKVQVWANNEWKDAPGFTDWRPAKSAVEEIAFPPVTTDKVRVIQKAGGGNKTFPNLMGLSEVEVF